MSLEDNQSILYSPIISTDIWIMTKHFFSLSRIVQFFYQSYNVDERERRSTSLSPYLSLICSRCRRRQMFAKYLYIQCLVYIYKYYAFWMVIKWTFILYSPFKTFNKWHFRPTDMCYKQSMNSTQRNKRFSVVCFLCPSAPTTKTPSMSSLPDMDSSSLTSFVRVWKHFILTE